MNDNYAVGTLRQHLNEQRNYLRLAGEQVLATRKRLADAEAERDKRQQYVNEIEEALRKVEETSE